MLILEDNKRNQGWGSGLGPAALLWSGWIFSYLSFQNGTRTHFFFVYILTLFHQGNLSLSESRHSTGLSFPGSSKDLLHKLGWEKILSSVEIQLSFLLQHGGSLRRHYSCMHLGEKHLFVAPAISWKSIHLLIQQRLVDLLLCWWSVRSKMDMVLPLWVLLSVPDRGRQLTQSKQ